MVAGISFGESGNLGDLDEAITNIRALVDLCASVPWEADHPECLHWLAKSLLGRFDLKRDIQDLHHACECFERELALRPTDCPARITTMGIFGISLLSRFRVLGHREDLDRAITHHTEVLDLRRSGAAADTDLSLACEDLANDLVKRFEEFGDSNDLIDAIDLHRKTLELRPHSHSLRHHSLNYLGRALTIYIQKSAGSDELDKLEEAVTHHYAALELCPRGHYGRVDCIADLVFAVRTLVEKGGLTLSSSKLQEAIVLGSEAMTLLGPRHPYLVDICRNLAVLHLKVEEFDSAFDLFRQATGEDTGGTRERLSVAVEWATAARLHKHESAQDAYLMAMDLLDRCQITYLTVDLKHEFLSRHFTTKEAASLSSDAASFAMEEDRLEDAVEILERGRTFVWATMRGYRPELAELRKVRPALAEQFQRLSMDVERFAALSELPQGATKMRKSHMG